MCQNNNNNSFACSFSPSFICLFVHSYTCPFVWSFGSSNGENLPTFMSKYSSRLIDTYGAAAKVGTNLIELGMRWLEVSVHIQIMVYSGFTSCSRENNACTFLFSETPASLQVRCWLWIHPPTCDCVVASWTDGGAPSCRNLYGLLTRYQLWITNTNGSHETFPS